MHDILLVAFLTLIILQLERMIRHLKTEMKPEPVRVVSPSPIPLGCGDKAKVYWAHPNGYSACEKCHTVEAP